MHPADKVRAGLESCGLAVDDSVLLIKRLASGASLTAIAREIALGGLLSKRSARGRSHVLTAVRRRYVEMRPPLLGVPDLASMVVGARSPLARAQVLLPYLLQADRAAFEVVTIGVLPRLEPGGILTLAQVQAALNDVLTSHGLRWGPAMTKRWAGGLLSILREVGALGRLRERELLQPYSLRPEAFAFHLWGLYASGLHGTALLDSPFWRLLLLRANQVRPMVRQVAERGWWRLVIVGGVEEVSPAHRSVTEWITHELG